MVHTHYDSLYSINLDDLASASQSAQRLIRVQINMTSAQDKEKTATVWAEIEDKGNDWLSLEPLI